MPKRIIGEAFGEILETGKQVVKQSKKAAGDISKQAGKTLVGRDKGDEEITKELYAPGEKASSKPPKKLLKKSDNISKMESIDKKKSMQMYEEIQEKIKLERRKKEQQPRKYESGKAEFDDEQVKDPESYFEKMKKKQDKDKEDKLSLSVKKGMGTGELARGTSG